MLTWDPQTITDRLTDIVFTLPQVSGRWHTLKVTKTFVPKPSDRNGHTMGHAVPRIGCRAIATLDNVATKGVCSSVAGAVSGAAKSVSLKQFRL